MYNFYVNNNIEIYNKIHDEIIIDEICIDRESENSVAFDIKMSFFEFS